MTPPNGQKIDIATNNIHSTHFIFLLTTIHIENMAAVFARSALRSSKLATTHNTFASRQASPIFKRFLATEQPRLRLGSEAPNFQAKTTQGDIDFHKWLGGKYVDQKDHSLPRS